MAANQRLWSRTSGPATDLQFAVYAPDSTEPHATFPTIRDAQACIKNDGGPGWRIETQTSL